MMIVCGNGNDPVVVRTRRRLESCVVLVDMMKDEIVVMGESEGKPILSQLCLERVGIMIPPFLHSHPRNISWFQSLARWLSLTSGRLLLNGELPSSWEEPKLQLFVLNRAFSYCVNKAACVEPSFLVDITRSVTHLHYCSSTSRFQLLFAYYSV